jgi:serine protease Do
MNPRFPLLAFTCALLGAVAHGETVKDREAAVRNDRAALEYDARWNYNDFNAGFAKAKETGKPLLVVLRCIPCHSCAGIDAQVLEDKSLVPLLDQFVCVRVINANALELAKFQFDYDLSLSAMFFNGDGTTYGRFGSWTHQRDPLDRTTAGFKAALEGALAIHRGYPANKAALAPKQGGPVPFKTPVEIPMLAAKYKATLDWEGKVVQSCVHCHQVGDAIRTSYRDQGKAVPPEWIYPFPQPETIGLTLAPDHAARVEAVAAGSPAAKAGVQAGDEIMSLAGQPLISPADVSWALHRSPESRMLLAAVVKRDNAPVMLGIALPAGWREKADISKRAGTWPMRAMALGGMILEDLADEDRAKLGIAKDRMALRAKGVGAFGKHAAAKNAGFVKDDVITELDGSSARITESGVIGKLMKDHKAGERVKTTVLRGDKRVELMLPIQ